MRVPVLIAALVSSAIVASAAFAADGDLPARKRYLPEYTKSGDLKLPKNFNEWVYVGSPLTPNGLNGGKANFPEFHNVYRSEEHTSELQSLMRISYGVFCLKKKRHTLPK